MQIIRFSKGSDLFVRGLRLENSPKIHIRFDSCEHVSVESISIISPEDSPNTDGIHIEDTTNAEIHHSTISTGNYLQLAHFLTLKKKIRLNYNLVDSAFLCVYITPTCLSYRRIVQLFEGSFFSTSISYAGDDCVSIGTGCYNVDINYMTCGPSHGIRY